MPITKIQFNLPKNSHAERVRISAPSQKANRFQLWVKPTLTVLGLATATFAAYQLGVFSSSSPDIHPTRPPTKQPVSATGSQGTNLKLDPIICFTPKPLGTYPTICKMPGAAAQGPTQQPTEMLSVNQPTEELTAPSVNQSTTQADPLVDFFRNDTCPNQALTNTSQPPVSPFKTTRTQKQRFVDLTNQPIRGNGPTNADEESPQLQRILGVIVTLLGIATISLLTAQIYLCPSPQGEPFDCTPMSKKELKFLTSQIEDYFSK